MSHSGSSNYPLPITGPTSASTLSDSRLFEQNLVEAGSRNTAKSVRSSSLTGQSKESLEVYSVRAHQRRNKIRSPSQRRDTNVNAINNNYDHNQV